MAVSTEKKENAVVQFFRESWSEMRKVVWPTQEETKRLTTVVVSVAASIGLLLFVCDLAFTWILRLM